MRDVDPTLRSLRRNILVRASKANEGHIPSALSILDILWVAYALVSERKQQQSDLCDQIILSKGHGSLALYEVLATFGYFAPEALDDFCGHESWFGGHPDRTKAPGVTASTGSLGHGLPLAIGLAMSQNMWGRRGQVLVVIGDGESNEGTTWESALLAAHHRLGNLTCVVDHNHSTDRAMVVDSLSAKFESFGWLAIDVDGHDHSQLREALLRRADRPIAVIAQTTKGKGVPAMEGNPAWHHGAPSLEELDRFLESTL